MLPVNNLIFDSTIHADGDWRDISNLTAFSIQLANVEGNVWIEASNNPDLTQAGVNISGNIMNAASNPVSEITILIEGSGNALFAPSCLVWNWIRVRKDATAQTKETKAWLFGQNG
jgi:hypothetical protein